MCRCSYLWSPPRGRLGCGRARPVRWPVTITQCDVATRDVREGVRWVHPIWDGLSPVRTGNGRRPTGGGWGARGAAPALRACWRTPLPAPPAPGRRPAALSSSPIALLLAPPPPCRTPPGSPGASGGGSPTGSEIRSTATACHRWVTRGPAGHGLTARADVSASPAAHPHHTVIRNHPPPAEQAPVRPTEPHPVPPTALERGSPHPNDDHEPLATGQHVYSDRSGKLADRPT